MNIFKESENPTALNNNTNKELNNFQQSELNKKNEVTIKTEKFFYTKKKYQLSENSFNVSYSEIDPIPKKIDFLKYGNQSFDKEVIDSLKKMLKEKIIRKEEIILGIVIYSKIIETRQNLNLIFSLEERQKVLSTTHLDPDEFHSIAINILIASRNLSEELFMNREKIYTSNEKHTYDYEVTEKSETQSFFNQSTNQLINHLGFLPEKKTTKINNKIIKILNKRIEKPLSSVFVVENYSITKRTEMTESDFIEALNKLKSNINIFSELKDSLETEIIRLNLKFTKKKEICFTSSVKGLQLSRCLNTSQIGSYYFDQKKHGDNTSLYILVGIAIPVVAPKILTNGISSFKDKTTEFLLYVENAEVIKLKEQVKILFSDKNLEKKNV